MKTEKRKIKNYNEHLHLVKLNQLTREVLPIIVEQRMILKSVESESLEDFKEQLNKATNFLNAEMSAVAMNKEKELKRLQEIETKLSQYSVKDEDVTSNGEFKPEFLNDLKESFITYYSKEEEEARAKLDEIITAYNELDINYRRLVNINYSYKLGYHAFANLHL